MAKKKKRRSPRAYKEEMIIDATLLATTGLSNSEIAKAIGVTQETLTAWKELHPIIWTAINQGRQISKNKSGTRAFHEYVYEHLPEHLQELWEDLEAVQRRKRGAREAAERLLQDRGKHARQQIFVYALTASNFNQSAACRMANISFHALRDWLKEPDFVDLMNEVQFHKKQFCESALFDLVSWRKMNAVIFANKNINRETYGTRIEVEHTGTINHTIGVVDITQLPFDSRKRILEELDKAIPEEQAALPNPNVIDGEFEIIDDESEDEDDDE